MNPALDRAELAGFAARHIGIDADAERSMLATIGAASRDKLVEALVPASILRAAPMRLPAALGEAEALAELSGIAAMNRCVKSCIGQGYHGTAHAAA